MTKQVVTTATVRADLLQDLQDLRKGKINNATARARAVMATAVLKTVVVEVACEQLGRSIRPVDLSVRQEPIKATPCPPNLKAVGA